MTRNSPNQPPPLENYNLFTSDRVLSGALEANGGGWGLERAAGLGRILGTPEAIDWGRLANEHPPILHTHDRFGNRRDEVEFHPAWHSLMRLSIENGLHSLPWTEPRPGGHVVRAALMFLAAQNECGHTCPVSMTFSSVPALRAQPDLIREWEPRIVPASYDPRFLPPEGKTGVLIGMAMTEKQGGSDLRATTTAAEPTGESRGRGEYLLTGHKWFCSAPMCDAFLTLAQAPRGLTCFLLPRWTPAGEQNNFHIQRLKQKLGNRSNASCEVEFQRAFAWRIGEEGRGVPAIIGMVQHTRLDCAIASAALMRQALAQAVHHAHHRHAFGKKLADQPLMRGVLADLAVESEAATLLMMRLARAFDAGRTHEGERAFARLATAAAKFRICKRAPAMVCEALECLGGNGYVEESILPRLYREAPLLSIWEGSGNVICLDAIRAIRKEPGALESVLAEISLALGASPLIGAGLGALERDLAQPADAIEANARRIASRIAVLLQASLLARHSPAPVFEAFLESRLARLSIGASLFSTVLATIPFPFAVG